jgi:hypothetical protein
MPVPDQITLYRLVHVETLPTLLTRGALHAPNWTPDDGLGYRTIHSVSVQASRHNRPIPCADRAAPATTTCRSTSARCRSCCSI